MSQRLMEHYVCTGGCEGVSDKPGVCQAKTCRKYLKPLIKCDCEDGKHSEILEDSEDF